MRHPFAVHGLFPRTIYGDAVCCKCGTVLGLAHIGKDTAGSPQYVCGGCASYLPAVFPRRPAMDDLKQMLRNAWR